MGEIIDVEFRLDRRKRLAALQYAADDRFLIEEGLELLRDFRSIRDPQIRRTLAAIVRDVAEATKGIATRSPKDS